MSTHKLVYKPPMVSAWLACEEERMEKICLNSSPSSLLSAKIGSVFELDGRDYILEGNHLVYLTLLDTSSSQWYR